MDSFLKILIGAGVLIFYVVRAVNKAKAEQSKSASKIPSPREPLEPYSKSQLDEVVFDFGKTEDVRVVNPPKTAVEKSFKKPSIFTQNTPSRAIEEREDDEDVHPILKDFDAQKAIIYSEIIKPPYL